MKTMPIFLILALFAPSVMAQSVSSSVKAHLFRLKPGQDLSDELSAYAKEHKLKAASIISAVGSLKKINLRYANQAKATSQEGFFEVVSLSGTLSEESMHLHASVSNSKGETFGGHLVPGNIIYTTLEIAIAEYENASFSREQDAASGYKELVVKTRSK